MHEITGITMKGAYLRNAELCFSECRCLRYDSEMCNLERLINFNSVANAYWIQRASTDLINPFV